MLRTLLLVLAVVCLVLAAFTVHIADRLNLVYLGLAFWAASMIPFENYYRPGGPRRP